MNTNIFQKICTPASAKELLIGHGMSRSIIECLMAFLLLNTMIFLVALIGGAMPLFYQKTQKTIPFTIAFAAGVLLGAALWHMLPESYEQLDWKVFPVLAVGFAVFFLPQKIIANKKSEEESFKSLGYLSFFGVAVHSLTDGIGVGALGPGDSILHVVFAVAVHKFPATVALTFLMMAAGFSRRQLPVFIFLFALTTPAGAYLTRHFLLSHNESLQGYALAFSAGNFLAVVFGDMTRKITGEPSQILPKVFFFLAGIAANMLHLH